MLLNIPRTSVRFRYLILKENLHSLKNWRFGSKGTETYFISLRDRFEQDSHKIYHFLKEIFTSFTFLNLSTLHLFSLYKHP